MSEISCENKKAVFIASYSLFDSAKWESDYNDVNVGFLKQVQNAGYQVIVTYMEHCGTLGPTSRAARLKYLKNLPGNLVDVGSNWYDQDMNHTLAIKRYGYDPQKSLMVVSSSELMETMQTQGLEVCLCHVGSAGSLLVPDSDALCSSTREDQKQFAELQKVFADFQLKHG